MDEVDWERKMTEASKMMSKMPGLKGMPFEVQYSLAYSRLVNLGKRQKLRQKYR